MQTSLEGIAKKAAAQPEYRFRNLAALLDEEFLQESWRDIKKNAADAVDKLTIKLQFGRYNFVVEADIRSYFDTIDHDWLVRMLEERINVVRPAAKGKPA